VGGDGQAKGDCAGAGEHAAVGVSLGLLALPDEAVGVMGFVPLALGVRGLVRAWRSDAAAPDAPADGAALTTVGVASITVANGADNIAIYASLFATFGAGDTAIALVVFAALVAVWCAAGLTIGTRRPVGAASWPGEYAVPVVLIALGVFILAESGIVDAVASPSR
jgi:cadmium resistance protein CadD (predicted permease)